MINTIEEFTKIYKELYTTLVIPNFNNVNNKLSKFKDLNGILLLSSKSDAKEGSDFISVSENSVMYFFVTMDCILKNGIDREFVTDLWNSGIHYDKEFEMFYLVV